MTDTKISLDITNLDNFKYDMSHCIKCKGCSWVDHTYMPGMDYCVRCPSGAYGIFDSFQAAGKMRIGLALNENKLKYSDELLRILYMCTLCGACDVGCKRNLDLEVELSLEAMRIKAVQQGAGPMPAHKKVYQNILKTGNLFGKDKNHRNSWVSGKIKLTPNADILYYAGCYASYKNTEIAESVLNILSNTGTEFNMFPDESCCGNVPFSVGMFAEAQAIAERNVEAIRKTGAKIVLTSCAECYRTLKVDYPKLLNISTNDLGFKVVHFVEYADELMKSGALKFRNTVNMRVAYHDSCSLARLSEPWTPWKGERELWGVVKPKLQRRRGANGIYEQPRNILRTMPGVQLIDTPRRKENSWCCAAGRGTVEAFPEFAAFGAEKKLEEVSSIGAEALISTCPRCKDNFKKAASKNGYAIKIYDISELVSAAISIGGNL